MRVSASLQILYLSCSLLLLASCSLHSMNSGEDVLTGAATLARKRAPIEVKIDQEYIHQDMLNVSVRLVPQTDLATGKIILILTGLNEGEVVEEQIKRLSTVISSEEVNEGDQIDVKFTMPSASITEYQIKCVWGEEALSYVTKFEKSLVASTPAPGVVTPAPTDDENKSPSISESTNQGLVLEEMEKVKEAQKCAAKSCDYIYVIKFLVVNRSQRIVQNIKLAMGVFWLEDGQDLEILKAGEKLRADEQSVDLSGVTLAPGQSKKISIRVDKPLPDVPGGAFVPAIRLLGFSEKP
ncbi:MAG: hypothetical protein IT292_11175 [Deltaproteobacteria bacterium]|nr:hypothetical protein [Deltaproteobacteria bacterium]